MTLQPSCNLDDCKNIIMLATRETSGELAPISQRMIVQYESILEMYQKEKDTDKSQIEIYKINTDTYKSQLEAYKTSIDTYKSQLDEYKEKSKKGEN